MHITSSNRKTWFTWWYKFDKLVVQPFVEENGLIKLPQSNYSLDYSKRIGLGVYLPQVNTYNYDLVVKYEDKIQHKLKYILLFRGWGDVDSDFPEYGVKYMKALELTPIITWEPWKRDFENPTVNQEQYSLQSIIDGQHDTYITDWANSARDANIEIIIRFAQEQSTPPNSQSWYPWQGDPERYVAAYRHIVDVFRQNKATNVKFMWSPIYTEFPFSEAYFPGADYVDYVGITSLNHGKNIGTEWERWKSCDEVFTPQYNAALKYNLPIIVSEIGSSEVGGSKADSILIA